MRRILVGGLFFLICAFFAVFLSESGYPAESISIISPKEPHFAGQAIVFHIQTREFFSPQKATVFYRTIGISIYRKLPMKKETPVDFRAFLKGQKAIPPGIEYFFVVQDGKGRVFTFPELDPKKHPFSLRIELDRHPPKVLKASPPEGATLKEHRPSIEISYADEETKVEPRSVHLLLDKTDVTQLAKVTEKQVLYTPPSDLSDGPHTITITMSDIYGNRMKPRTWTFSIPKSKRFQKASASINWDGELRHKLADKDTNQQPDWNINSSATLDTLAEWDNMKTSFNANVWYVEEEGPGAQGDTFNLNNFLYQLQRGKQQLALGDVTVQGTELVSQSISRRGGRVSLEFLNTRAELFALRSNSITGFNHGLGFSDPDQRLVGGSVEKEILSNKRLTLKTTYLEGRNKSPDNYNSSTLEAGTEGNIFSVSLSSRVLGEKLAVEGEYSTSRFDTDLSDGFGKDSDKAWLLKISGREAGYNWDTGYKYLGPDFHSIASPTGSYDREELSAGGGIRLPSSFLSLRLVHNKDNVDEDPLMPVIRNSTGTLSYNLNITGWPSIFFINTYGRQDSTKEPATFTPIENETNSSSAGFSIAKERWNLTPTYTFTLFNDKGSTNNDSKTHVLSLAGGVRPIKNLSISPSFSYTNLYTKLNGVTTETYQGTLGGVMRFLDNMVNLNATISYLETKADDGSSHTSTLSNIAQLNWDVEKYLLKKCKQTLSLRGQYSRTRNHITGDTQNDYSVYGVISFGIPIKLY
ncbi:MAG: hypothetical protein JRI84_05720 [Deltaproteobacteria bacterium]|nr:hypothetical protein [Deltaproteobacteria bacterium]MBW1935035.1 hypothetical protein [Deltaproteobacteria bacterium]